MRFANRSASLCLVLLTILACGCGDSPTGGGKIATVLLDVSPVDPCISPGESVAFSAVATNGSTPYSYAWTFTGADIATSDRREPAPTYPAKGIFSASVEVTDATGSKVGTSMQVRVKDNCTAVLASIRDPLEDLTVETGTTVDFAGLATGGDPPYAFNWQTQKDGGTPVPAGEGDATAIQFTEPGKYLVTLFATDQVGERDADRILVTVGSGSMFVEIQSPEDGSIVGAGDKVKFSPVVTGGIAPYSWYWKFGAGSGIADSSEQAPLVIYNTPGMYSAVVDVTDSEGAMSTATVMIEVATIRSFSTPIKNTRAIINTPSGFQRSLASGDGKMLLGFDGAAIFDPVSLQFGPVILAGTSFFGGAVATPAGGSRQILFYNFTGVFHSTRDAGSGLFGTPVQFPGGVKARDLQMFGDDPGSGAFVLATFSGLEFYEFNAGTGEFERSAVFGPALFPGTDGNFDGAFARAAGEGFIATIGSSPGQLWYHDGVEGNNGTLVGELGDTPQKIAYLDGVAVVANLRDDTCSVILWGAGSDVTIVGGFATGRSPRSTDLMRLQNGNIGCVVAGRNDNSFTVAEITTAGVILSSRILSTTDRCGSPDAIAWAEDGSTDVLAACLSDQNLIVLDSGL